MRGECLADIPIASAAEKEFFARLKRLAAELGKSLSRRGVPEHDRDDVVQQTLLELIRHRSRLYGLTIEELSAYAARAALHSLFKVHRTATRRQRREQEWLWQEIGVHASSPEDIVSRIESISRCIGLLATLPMPYQDVVRARIVEELSTSETASKLGVPVGTVKTRLLKAREALHSLDYDPRDVPDAPGSTG